MKQGGLGHRVGGGFPNTRFTHDPVDVRWRTRAKGPAAATSSPCPGRFTSANRRDDAAQCVEHKLTTVGSSLGFIVPKAAQDHLKIENGDTIWLTEAPDGTLSLTPYSPDFERQMKLAEQIMDENRDALRALAK